MRIILASLVVPMALSATSVAAQDAAPAPQNPPVVEDDFGGDSITVGVGAAMLPSYEGADDYNITPAPGAIGSVSGFAFLLAGNRLSVDLVPNQPGPVWDVQAGPLGVVNFNRNRRDAIDDARVRALPTRGLAVELGGYLGIGKTGVLTSPYDKLSVSVSYRHDVSGVHDAGILVPTINYVTPLSRKAAAGLFVSAERAERGYAQSYFGISPTDAIASGLPAFDARGGWKNYTLGALGTVALSGDLLHGWKLVAGGTYRRMLNDFGDSPVVSIAGDRDQWLGAVGIAYTF